MMLTADERIALIRKRLQALNPTKLSINDESAAHVGHSGAAMGAGHFAVTIESPLFKGKNRVTQQRLVYQVLGDLMNKEIHALKLQTQSPDENPVG